MKTKTQTITQLNILNHKKGIVSTTILQILACALFSFLIINQAHSASMIFVADTTINQDETISNEETWTINEGVTLTIPQGVTVFLSFEAEIINNGGIINNSGEIFLAESGIDNVEGVINNDGHIFNSEGSIVNSGTINNSDSGTIGIETGLVRNTSSGLIDNAGIIDSQEGSEIENSGTINIAEFASINNGSTITNLEDGIITIFIDGVITNNEGIINNFGTISNFEGGIDNVEGNITNSGTIFTSEGAIFNSGGTITNNPVGRIDNLIGFLTNTNSGLIDNSGVITIKDDSNIDNSGTINNSGTITNSELSFITNSGTIDNAESGVINNGVDGTINNTGSINNNGTIDNCFEGEPGTIAGPIFGNPPIECQGETTPLSFTPVADSTIKFNKSTENFGADREVQTDNSPMQDFLIKFNVSEIGTRHIRSAKLRLFCTNGSDKGGAFHLVKNDWSEDTVTWDNAPLVDSEAIASLGPVVRQTWVEVDLTSLITEDGIYSLRVMSSSKNGADYRSKEKSGLEPELVITVE